MTEPDYEAIMEDRAERRAERYMDRMDAKYGRIEDHRVVPQCGSKKYFVGGMSHACGREMGHSGDHECQACSVMWNEGEKIT